MDLIDNEFYYLFSFKFIFINILFGADLNSIHFQQSKKTVTPLVSCGFHRLKYEQILKLKIYLLFSLEFYHNHYIIIIII